MIYYLMNKDIKVLSFEITEQFGIKNIYVKEVYQEDLIPVPLQNSNPLQWLNSRFAISKRTNIRTHFIRAGIITLNDRIAYTNCISLTDTYWVKKEDDERNWDILSPYKNPPNETMADYAFGKDHRTDDIPITKSPDFSLGGSFPKCWRAMDDKIYLYKAGSRGAFNSGNEPYSEIFVSELAQKMEIDSVVYELVTFNDITCTRCGNICSEDRSMYTFNQYFPDVNCYKDLFFLDFGENIHVSHQKLADMLLLDFLTLNIDRHFDNISVLVSADTQTLLGIAPVYDYNLALMPYYVPAVDGTIDHYINNHDIYQYCKDDTLFDDMFRMIVSMTSAGYIRSKLSLMQDMAFIGNRSDIAAKIVERQLNRAHWLLK